MRKAPLPALVDPLLQQDLRNGIGNDLDGADHLPCDDRLVGRQGGGRHGLVDGVEAVDRVDIDDENARGFGIEIGAPGEGCFDSDVAACKRMSKPGGRLVFSNVAGFEPGCDEGLDAGLLQAHGDFRRDEGSFLHHRFARPHAVGRQGPDRLLDWNLAELHAERLRSLRRLATISARMETAISAGETAPISRPMGAWMRARSASVNPDAVRR